MCFSIPRFDSVGFPAVKENVFFFYPLLKCEAGKKENKNKQKARWGGKRKKKNTRKDGDCDVATRVTCKCANVRAVKRDVMHTNHPHTQRDKKNERRSVPAGKKKVNTAYHVHKNTDAWTCEEATRRERERYVREPKKEKKTLKEKNYACTTTRATHTQTEFFFIFLFFRHKHTV